MVQKTLDLVLAVIAIVSFFVITGVFIYGGLKQLGVLFTMLTSVW